jgi:4-hydroxybenzoate polyprenyltransferase
VAAATGTLLLLAAIAAAAFLRQPVPGAGKRFELVSGVWTLVLYVSLGLVPLAWRWFKGG